ncbi:Hypothetical predicted protein [Mytilus galloprovincialis]|uniref:Uncharacterized protein n=1 Tax=Mytilus galloprovincialis TaxID=29158 RepID=A0A8B6HNZ8_MYTGA|nr:Hypothetical predicted protein [Mytilus galloprovincialis]
MNKTNTLNCHHPCLNPNPYATCGSDDNLYADVYEQDVEKKYYGEKSKAEADKYIHNINCQLFGDDWITLKYEIPNNNTFIWTSFIRSKVCILKKYTTKNKIPNHSKCLFERDHSWNNTLLSLRAGNKHATISLSCNTTTKSMCKGGEVKYTYGNDDRHTGKEHNQSTIIPSGSKYSFSSEKNSAEWKRTMPTQVESKSESTIEKSTSRYEFDTTINPLLVDNSVFFLQIGIAIIVSCFVLLIATLSCCVNRPKRGTYTFPISRSEDNIVMAVEGNSHQPTAVLADNYSEPVDKASTSNEVEGPRFCATKPCQNTNYQKTENGEYQHLDFTLRSETAKRFADTSEYDHVRGNVVSVFDQPWDTATSKVNKLFSQISKNVVIKGQNIRKSLIKRRESRSGSPKLKCRTSDYCEAWKTQLNKQQFAFDNGVDNQSNISIDEATVDSYKHEAILRSTDSAFPVLPYSERINVKSTHINDEPDDRRMSLRERLLHMISIRPLKMPFGIELDLRASRSKSKIYSLATSIEEKDESVA